MQGGEAEQNDKTSAQEERAPITPDTEEDGAVVWEASEYVHHQKTAGWFITLTLVTGVLALILFWLIRDIFSIIVLILMAITVGVFAARPPRTLRYSLSHDGLSVGDKHYGWDEFRSYSLAQDGAVMSVNLLPTKRFMVPVTVYFSPQDEAGIARVLEANLPHEERPPDIIDRWTSRLRF